MEMCRQSFLKRFMMTNFLRLNTNLTDSVPKDKKPEASLLHN